MQATIDAHGNAAVSGSTRAGLPIHLNPSRGLSEPLARAAVHRIERLREESGSRLLAAEGDDELLDGLPF
jgi:hypothetical protein